MSKSHELMECREKVLVDFPPAVEAASLKEDNAICKSNLMKSTQAIIADMASSSTYQITLLPCT